MRHVLAIGSLLLLSACALPPEFRLPPVQENASSSTEFSESSSARRGIAEGDIGGEAPAVTPVVPIDIEQRLLSGGLLEVGSPLSPVTLLVFTNHACSYCRTFQETYVPRLIADFVQPGKLRILTVPFPLKKYPQSEGAARALVCAAQQGKGHEMHEQLFTKDRINELGLDATRFEDCQESMQTTAILEAQKTIADALGVTLVPTFFLSGERTVGLMEESDLRGALEAALAE